MTGDLINLGQHDDTDNRICPSTAGTQTANPTLAYCDQCMRTLTIDPNLQQPP